MKSIKNTTNTKTTLSSNTSTALGVSQDGRSPLVVPLRAEPVAQSFFPKYMEGTFLGRTSPENATNQRRQYSQIRCVARNEFLKGMEALEPTEEALERTKSAAKDFFMLAYQMLDQQQAAFPLAGRNKCLGMVAVPTSKVVMIAISQDKDPSSDELLRSEMIAFLTQLNKTTKHWIFELACIPTKAQYLMPRTLSMRVPQAAPESSVTPHTRCVEVALMAALCKAGRTLNFTAADTGIIAFGGTLWASATGADAIPHFEGVKRNKKYTEKAPIEVKLTQSLRGYIDIWEPCPGHCKKYRGEMLAIGGAGGLAGSFYEPRSEGRLPKAAYKPENSMNITQNINLGIASGLMFAAICAGVSCLWSNEPLVTQVSRQKFLYTIVSIMASLGFLYAANRGNKAEQKVLVSEAQDDAPAVGVKRPRCCSF